MRRLVLILCLLAAPAWALSTIVADGPQHGGGCSGFCTLIANNKTSDPSSGSGGTISLGDTTGANLIIVACSYYSSGQVNNCLPGTDSKGNTWTQLDSNWQSSNFQMSLFYKVSPTVGAGHTIPINCSPGACYFSACAQAWQDGGGTPAYDTGTAGYTTSAQPGSITPSVNGALVFSQALSGNAGTFSVDSGMTISDQTSFGSNVEGGACAYKVQGTAAAINPTWSGPPSIDESARAAFKP